MRTHFFLGVPHTVQSRDERVIADRFVRGAQSRKHQTSDSAHIVKRMQNFQRLQRKGHQMVMAHLHALSRNTPKVFLEVDFRPFPEAHLTGAQEGPRQQLQPGLDSEGTREVIHGPLETAYGFWFSDGGAAPRRAF